MFRQDFTCPALLKDWFAFTRTGLSPAMAGLSRPFRLSQTNHWPVPLSLATTDGISLMSVPPGTEMFQFPGFASSPLWIHDTIPLRVGCPIRISTDQSLLAAPHGFSQRATSFIASWCQGIHRMPLSYSDPDSSPRRSRGRTTMHGNHRQNPCVSARTPFASGTRGEPRSIRAIVPFGSQSIISARNPNVSATP